ncbi:MAG: hypothetical protein L6R42_007949, partial [Xanthoria sp. 1 TBL-2021]
QCTSVLITKVERWNMTFKSLFYYADIVQRYYNSAVPFTMRTAKRDFVHTSSLAHIKELGEVPESRLSMFALAEDMLQPKYTMNGFEVLEVNVAGTSLQYRVLRTLLTTLDPVFLDAALAYPEGIFKAAEALRYVPEFLTSWVCNPQLADCMLTTGSTIVSWITQDSRASKTLVEYLTPEIEYRMNERQSCNPRVPKPALSYALFDICDHPEYVVPLREELGLRTMEASPSDLPLMDSFLKESSRLHPVDTGGGCHHARTSQEQ